MWGLKSLRSKVCGGHFVREQKVAQEKLATQLAGGAAGAMSRTVVLRLWAPLQPADGQAGSPAPAALTIMSST